MDVTDWNRDFLDRSTVATKAIPRGHLDEAVVAGAIAAVAGARYSPARLGAAAAVVRHRA